MNYVPSEGLAPLASRGTAVSSSPTSAMRNRARAHQGSEAVVNLASGEVAHAPPRAALIAAQEGSSTASTHGYGATAGQPRLREAIAARMGAAGVTIEPSQAIVTSGAKQALAHACTALLDPGDQALVPVPSWPTYREAVRLAGGEPVPVPTAAAGAFKVDPEQLEASLTARARALILASPNNPTGTVYERRELREIADWALSRNLWLIVDEVYDELVYAPGRGVRMLAAAPHAAPQCVVIDSVAKRWAMPGWRVGWLLGPANIVAAVSRIQSHTSSHVPNICQTAACAAIESGEATVDGIRALLAANREVALRELGRIDAVDWVAPLGAFYVFADMRRLLEDRAGGGGGAAASCGELVEELFERYRLALVAGAAFGAPGFVRISFGVPPAELAEGLRRLQGFAVA